MTRRAIVARTFNRAVRIRLLRKVLLVSLAIVVIFPLINIFVVYPAFAQLIITAAEGETTRLATHLITIYLPEEVALREELSTGTTVDDLEAFRKSSQLVKLRVFSESGEILHSTIPDEIGEFNQNDYFFDVVSTGHAYSKLVRKASNSREGQVMTVDVIETYVPIMRNGTFYGAVEVYHDITDQLASLDTRTRRSDIIQLVATLCFLAMILTIALRMIKTQEINDRLLRALEQSPSMIMVTDTDGRVEYANSKFEEITGCKLAEVTGRTPHILEPSNYSPEAYLSLSHAISSGGEWQGEVRSQKKDGQPYDEFVTLSPIFDPAGEYTRVLIVREDITDRKQAEREVRQEKEYFQAILQNNPLAIVALDLDSQVAACNRAFLELYGYSETEVTGQKLDALISSEDTSTEAKHYTERVNRGELIYNLTQRRRKDGSLVDVELYGVPVIVDEEQVGMLGLYRDVSERVKNEAALQQAKNAAEAATSAKSEFLANMSHEIRTPLNAIIGMTGLLLDAKMTSQQREFVETIRASGDALLSVINDILDFSKIEAGRLELEAHIFNLRDCVEDSLDLLAPAAGKKGLDLAYDIEPGVPINIVGDVTRLRQVLVNLLSNAVKFTHAGEVVVLVDGCFLENEEYEVHFAVKDTGIGIPADRISQLFESFNQVDASTTRKYGGTGLGLSISKHLVEMMRGSIQIESKVGIGSTFHFTVVGQTGTGLLSPYLLQDHPVLTGKRLLIVDDSPTNRAILMRQAESWGMIASAAASAQDALASMAAGNLFDLAIVDMQMPQMNGIELAGQIRQTWTEGRLPLIMLTSLGRNDGNSANGLFNAFLTKPVKPSQLYNILVNIISGNQIADYVKPVTKRLYDPSMGQRHPLRILLAEDNLVNQKVAVRILERLGYRADVAADGLEVLAALERQSYDVVLMDIQMPEMDGVQTTKTVRRRWPVAQQPRIIAMTANALAGDRERYLDYGMDDYVSKPVHIEHLIEVLEKCPSRNGNSPGSPESHPVSLPPPNGVSRSSSWPIDTAFVEKMYGGKVEIVLDEVLPVFIENTTQLVAVLQESATGGERSELMHIAHTLKGSSANLGVLTLVDLCQEIENRVSGEDWDNVNRLVSQVTSEFESIRSALLVT